MLRPDTLPMTLMLALLAAMGPLSTDMYLASLPAMTEAFSATVGGIQLTLSVYMAGFALSQIFFGPLSDRFGRRPLLLGGLLLYSGSGLACAFAPNIETLIGLRLLQAIGACVGPVLSRAVVRDLYGREGSARAMSHMGTAMAVAPFVAPILGSYLSVWFGWQANFYFMGAYGLIGAAAVWALLAESVPQKDLHALRPSQMARNFSRLLRDRSYLGYTLACSFCYGGLFAFISGSSFVLIDMLGVAQENFGYFFAMGVGGYMLGTVVSGRLAGRLSMSAAVAAGATVSAGAGVAMAGMAWAGIDSVTAVVAPMVVYMAGMGIVLPQAQSAAIAPYPQMAGSASALLGTLQYSFAAIVGVGVGQLDDGTQIPMTTAIGLMGVLTLAAYWLIAGKRRDPGLRQG